MHGSGAGLHLKWVVASAEELPFESDSMDSYTVAFGIRNVTHRDAALAEAHRVLKRGGRFLCLEFSPVDTPVFKDLYDAYSMNVIPKMGQLVANDAESYRSDLTRMQGAKSGQVARGCLSFVLEASSTAAVARRVLTCNNLTAYYRAEFLNLLKASDVPVQVLSRVDQEVSGCRNVCGTGPGCWVPVR